MLSRSLFCINFYDFSWNIESNKNSEFNWIQLNRVIIHFSSCHSKCFYALLCSASKAHMKLKILLCGGWNVVMRESHKRLAPQYSSYHKHHCLSSAFNFSPFVILHKRSNKKAKKKTSREINWDIKMFSAFLLKRQKRFLFRVESQKVTGIILRAIFRGWSSVSNIFLRCALLLVKQHVKKRIVLGTFSFLLGVSPILFHDLWAWIFNHRINNILQLNLLLVSTPPTLFLLLSPA